MSMTLQEIYKVVEFGFGICGRMADGSKRNPKVYYNANILVGKKKVWFGDFHKYEKIKLRLLAEITGEDVWLLREMDCRFDTESNPNFENPLFHFSPNKQRVTK